MKRQIARSSLLRPQKRTATKRPQQLPTQKQYNKLYDILLASGGIGRVCVIRSLGGIGDVLMTTPLLKEIKRVFPKCHLTFAIDRRSASYDVYGELVKNAFFIDEIIDSRYVVHKDYLAVVDVTTVCIQYENRNLPVMNRIDIFARAAGFNYLADPLPFYQPTSEELMQARVKLAKYKEMEKKLVLLHTASFDKQRSWTAEQMTRFIKLMGEKRPDVQIIISDYNNVLTNKTEFENAAFIHTSHIREFAAIIHEIDLFIGPDSGPMHLAGAMNKKSLVLFGSIPPAARINYYRSHQAIVLDGLSCLGCWYKACPINIKCMRDLSAEMVLTRVISMIGESSV